MQPVVQRSRSVAITFALVGASAVVLGAAGAHALHLDARATGIWQTAVGYHFWHALAFSVAAFAAPRGRARRVALCAFVVGMLLFCGSLYALALGAPSQLGMLTPIGGVAFVIGWLALASSLGRHAVPSGAP
ncbi:MAG: DUF423 domain-containing protein [Xanthomonadales bacterium]|nr:DUF423 domain-containing protein [Xanthomonadales bacterium]